MPRSREEHERRARKYGRRRRLLKAQKSAKALDKAVEELLADLSRSRVPKPEQARLKRAVGDATDITRRRAAIWAVVDALEDDESQA